MAGESLSTAVRLRQRLGPFFEHALVPVIVVERDGRFVTANQAALAKYGYSLGELVDMHIHDFLANPRPEVETDLLRAFEGDPKPLDRRPHRRKDGSVLWVVPVAGPQVIDGETYIVSTLQDVTALATAEQQAHVEHDRVEVLWEAAVERFGGSFALLDRDLRIKRVNRTLCKWMQLSEEQLLGKRCAEVFTRRCSRHPCPHEIALAEHRSTVEEVVGHSGLPLRVDVHPAPENDAGIAVIHVAHDLTDERAMRARLMAADRLANLGRVVAGVAHEDNNPAAFVTRALPMARDRIAQGRSAEALTLLEEATGAMAQITEVMRDLGGVTRDRPRALLDLATVANGAIRIASHEADARAKVERVFEDGVTAEARGARLGQVVLNLVLNAAQAIPAGNAKGHAIEVRVRRAGDRALLEVADTGPGVPEGVGDRIFEPFFTTRGTAGGTGLGLWLSRAIVEEEGGTLTWRNRPEGGAVFTVSLPAYRVETVVAAATAE
ncbi:MAG TPA: ATP-binding protein [Polyangiaceae bacterium]